MRIDLILASATAGSRVRAAWVDRKARKGTAPSDHAPVIADLDEAPDGDIGPVVPPPSARPAGRGPARLPQFRQALPPAGPGALVTVAGLDHEVPGGPARPPRRESRT